MPYYEHLLKNNFIPANLTDRVYDPLNPGESYYLNPLSDYSAQIVPRVRTADYSGNQRMATKTNKNTGTQRRQRNRRRQRQRGNNVTTRVVIPPASGGVIYSNPSMPNFRTYGDSTIVRNTEVVSNVAFNAGAGLFSGFSDALIAELPGWLTQLADLYSKWRWRALTVIYIPSCPTSTSGRVAMCMSYDRNDAAATTVTQITQGYKAIVFPPYAGYEGAHVLNSGRNNNVAGAICMEVDITRFDKMWYPTINGTAFSALATTIQNSYCPCSYVIGSDGGPAGAAAGNIYLKYEIEFIEPINPTMNV